jgi:kynurenine formamidase
VAAQAEVKGNAQEGAEELGDPRVDSTILRVSNWGRWGPLDEIGTLNFVTEEARRNAARLVRNGKVFSLAIPFDSAGPQPAGDRRLNPQHVMLETGTDVASGVQLHSLDGSGYADDMVTMALQSATQWDALSHAFYAYKMYNDRDCRLVGARGAEANAIDRLSGHVVGRGVLVDVPRSLGLDRLPVNHEITPLELQTALDYERVEVRQGDFLLIRTGHLAWARRNGRWEDFVHHDEPGIGLDALPLLHEKRIAGIAADNWAFEVLPAGCSIMFPVHAAAIVHMGLLIGEMFDLEALADDCARDNVFEFMFAAPPLPLTHAVGSPINPIAIK